jgi:hypothetical protein
MTLVDGPSPTLVEGVDASALDRNHVAPRPRAQRHAQIVYIVGDASLRCVQSSSLADSLTL